MASSNPQVNNNADFRLENLFSTRGKTALVSGGGSGIGLMISQALAVNGAHVYIFSRTQEKLDRVVETYNKGDIDGKITALQGDVSSKESIQKLVEEYSKHESKLDILVNNAGIAGETTTFEAKTAEQLRDNLFNGDSFDNWESVYRTNVTSAYFLTAACLPLLNKSTETIKGWSATVLNIISISGSIKISQHHPAYNSSKAAFGYLNKVLANEFALNGFKIRVNGISPGVFHSEMTAGDSSANQKSETENEKYKKLPSGRVGADQDMAQAVLFAILDQYLNGQSIIVDGGYQITSGGQ
ncbi:NAD(P)-binding protein [Wallemia mellicola]|nr:NAD(P)-binding protein [Wallemia mellicola]TIC05870.1 NAD(P)-binding protein [Wallemia mellicola]TIC11395.1 NAD(P)-binding protein [Wallemia mellicola]TIC43823.1 NAD(P)-binding protein [Wallemia mellicola]TIC57596.1 NAD(P)-binding protein [Wallemia mellicola]